MRLVVKKCSTDGVFPTYATAGSAALDLHSTVDAVLIPGQTLVFWTGIQMQIPEGFCGLVCSRSGMAAKHSVFVLNAPGVIDSDYHKEVGIILHNAGRSDYHVKKGDRIAQMLIQPTVKTYIVMDLDMEDETGRGGFGSTGK